MVGFAALLCLAPLAVTSTDGWVRRLGYRRWKLLHRLVYLAAALAVVHFAWRVKADLTQAAPLRGDLRGAARGADPGVGARGTPRAEGRMIDGKRVCVVMPAYNAERTLGRTYAEIDRSTSSTTSSLVDDASPDDTVRGRAASSGSTYVVHPAATGATAATRRPATARRWPAARTSS